MWPDKECMGSWSSRIAVETMDTNKRRQPSRTNKGKLPSNVNLINQQGSPFCFLSWGGWGFKSTEWFWRTLCGLKGKGIGDLKYFIGFALYLATGGERSIWSEILNVAKPSNRSPGRACLYSLTITVIVVTGWKDDARKEASLLKVTQILSFALFPDYARAYYGGGDEDLHACIFLAWFF